MKNIRLGDVLIEFGYITPDQLNTALAYQKEHRDLRVGQALQELGYVNERQVLEALAQRLQLTMIDIEHTNVDVTAVEKVPQELAQKYDMLPIAQSPRALTIAANDPLNYYALEDIRQLTGLEPEIVLAELEPLRRAIRYYYAEVSARKAARSANSSDMAAAQTEDLAIDMTAEGGDLDAPIIRLLNSLVQRAVTTTASDIHIEPFEGETKVRMRIDGVIIDYVTLQRALHQPLIARIKIMSNMDISETRLPQDGRFTVKAEGREVNIRVSTLPTTYGENIVLRLLDSRSGIIYDLPKLGMNQADYATITRCIRKPYGMILSTGPTGSGKSSSLYAILKMLNREDVNIITLEDPVEYRLPGVRQVQLNVRAGMTFSSGLRSILRQDPDIIMVGEIRDKETAEIAVQAAMTGHLVLSTLHTNDALSAVYRLVDMGVPSYLVKSVLLCTFAQRLVRTICPNCRQEYVPAEGMLRDLGLKPEDGPFYHGAGCPQCGGTGYAGRMAIFEVMPMSEEINQMVLKGESMQTVYRHALENGLHTMRRDAADKIRAGLTTCEEALRVTMA